MTRALLGGSVVFCVALLVHSGGAPIVTPILLLLTALFSVLLVEFGSLTLTIDEQHLICRFGPGPIRFRFRLDEIRAAEKIRTHWYYGWGIRFIGRGWLYNVSGFDAVEIVTSSGRRYAFGTDQPEELLAAIRSFSGLDR